jgi:hypothetical protein
MRFPNILKRLTVNSRSTALNWFAVALGIAMIWIPEVSHYWVPSSAVHNSELSNARTMPSAERLKTVARQSSLSIPDLRTKEAALRAADLLLSGTLTLPRFDDMQIGRPLGLADLTKGAPTAQLQVASLVTVDILLRAYEYSAQEKFLDAARQDIIAFAEIERSQWVQTGYLWNDHAIAARVGALVRFLIASRDANSLDNTALQSILGLIKRSGALLSKPALFTFATNHGAMQSIALLQIAAAFPYLENVEKWKSVACERLQMQMQYYVSPDGVVLEHSSTYHALGMDVLEYAFTLLPLVNCVIPADWQAKKELGARFTSALQRPDGNFPAIGNTEYIPEHVLKLYQQDAPTTQAMTSTRKAPVDTLLLPVSGYAIWWRTLNELPEQQALAQTTTTWSYFQGHGHKHADDLSVLIWAGGRSWITNVGYWPYGYSGLHEAVNWRGSNAPHIPSEAMHSERQTTLLSYSNNANLRFLELLRTTPNPNVRIARQIIELPAGIWMVLDIATGDGATNVTRVWTTMPDLRAENISEQTALVHDAGGGLSMRMDWLGSDKTKTSYFKGSRDPFAGWVVIDGAPTAAPAWEVEQSAEKTSWVLSTFRYGDTNHVREITTHPALTFTDAEHWVLELNSTAQAVKLMRDGNRLRYHPMGKQAIEIALEKGPDVSRERLAIRTAFQNAADIFPRTRDVIYYRYRLTKFAFVLLVLQELGFLVITFFFWRWHKMLRLLSALLWLGMGAYCSLIYLRTY